MFGIQHQQGSIFWVYRQKIGPLAAISPEVLGHGALSLVFNLCEIPPLTFEPTFCAQLSVGACTLGILLTEPHLQIANIITQHVSISNGTYLTFHMDGDTDGQCQT